MQGSFLVSVIIPCYNQGIYLDEAVESVLHQTYPNIEIIIINDGSTDPFTNQLLEQYYKPRTKVIHTLNQGLAEARNTGIKNSAGKYILPLDADDKLAPEYIAEAVEVLENKKDVKIVYCEAEYFEAKTGKWDLPAFEFRRLLLENLIFCTALFRRSEYDQTDGYDPHMKFGWEDWEFWIALLAKGGEVYRIPQVRFYYRVKEQSMISALATNAEKIRYSRTYVFHKHYDLYKKHKRLVTIIVLNYNQALFLKKRIVSILLQTYPFFELLLLDDGSTDNSREIIESYQANDKRIRAIYHKGNRGNLFTKWNEGVEAALGEYVWIAEPSDYADTNFLEQSIRKLDVCPKAGLVYCQSWRVDEQDTIKSSWLNWTDDFKDKDRWNTDYSNRGAVEISKYLIYKNTIPNASAVVFRKNIYLKAGKADPIVQKCGDWFLWLKMLLISDIAYVSQHYNFYRERDEEELRRFSKCTFIMRTAFEKELLREASADIPHYRDIYYTNRMLFYNEKETYGIWHMKQGDLLEGIYYLLSVAFYPKISTHKIKVCLYYLRQRLQRHNFKKELS